MKKALLGTTALVAGGLFAGAATAADIIPAPPPPEPEPIEEGFTLTVTGDATSSFNIKDTDECDDGEPVFFSNNAIANAAGFGNLPAGNYGNGACVASDAANVAAIGANNHFRHDDEATTVFWDAELQFHAEQTLANGLQVAARIELDGQDTGAGNTRIDEHWIRFQGYFGELKIGADDSAMNLSFVGTPGVTKVIGTVAGQDAAAILDRQTADGNIDGPLGDSYKVIYFTPRFGGLQVGVSFAPADETGNSQESDNSTHVLDSGRGWINEFAVGANYQQSWGDYGIEIGGGWGTADAQSTIDSSVECIAVNATGAAGGNASAAYGSLTGDYACGDLDYWGIGGNLSSSYLTLGVAYSTIDYDYGFERDAFYVEALFESGDWNYGVGYGHESDDHQYGFFDDDTDIWAAGIGKTLGPGVDVSLFFNHRSEDQAYRKALGLGELDGWSLGLGAAVAF